MNDIDHLFPALGVFLAVGALLFAFTTPRGASRPTVRAVAVASFSVGFVIAWALCKDQGTLGRLVEEMTDRGGALVLAFLGGGVVTCLLRRRGQR